MTEAAAKLEARVERMVTAAEPTEREQKLAVSCKWLLDRLAVSVATSIRAQMRAEANESEALADLYEDGANFLLDDSPKWMARREGIRGEVAYQRAELRIREALSIYLRNGSGC